MLSNTFICNDKVVSIFFLTKYIVHHELHQSIFAASLETMLYVHVMLNQACPAAETSCGIENLHVASLAISITKKLITKVAIIS